MGKNGHGGKIAFDPADAALIKSGAAIFCAGYTLGEERLVDLTLAALNLARQHRVPIFFDPGPQMALAPAELRQAVLSLVDTLLLTEEEIPLLAEAGLDQLRRIGPPAIVLKQGAGGCTIYLEAAAAPLKVPGYPVEVVDTSAAGDSFDAAFIIGARWGWSWADCAKLANAAGAAKVRKLGGGRSVPTRAEVQAVIEQFEVDIRLVAAG